MVTEEAIKELMDDLMMAARKCRDAHSVAESAEHMARRAKEDAITATLLIDKRVRALGQDLLALRKASQ